MIRTVAWIALVAVSLAVWLVAVRAYGFDPGVQGSDAWNYLAAGERLNAGHPLYAVSPGDRPVVLVPPYWTVPLLAPPPIAVAWRPLALLGEPAMTVWAGVGLGVTLLTAAWLLARGGLIVAAIIAVMSPSLALQSLSGNVNGLLFGAVVVVWMARSRPVVAGSLLAGAIAIKLTPALLLLWLVASRRWRASAMTGFALVAIGGVSLLGAGLGAHLDWLASVPRSQPAPMALASLTGLPSIVVIAILGLIVLAVSLRRDERLTFSAAVVAAALASPALYLGTLGIAAAAAAPWISPDGGILREWRRRTALRTAA
ncbi:MAG TPA: glycosyltransferase family 87 protein [Candidatus Limnocylindrales bacterium]|nr:glycosyltransferase family 87 protein [Candidatus Limnocylindrales bacterium]